MTPHSPADYGSLFSSIVSYPGIEHISCMRSISGFKIPEGHWHCMIRAFDPFGRPESFEGIGPTAYYALLTAKSLLDDYLPPPPDMTAVANFSKPTASGIALLAELGLNKPKAEVQGIRLGARP